MNDLASEYGRLLAERDRLIGLGVEPDELELPLPPPIPDDAWPSPGYLTPEPPTGPENRTGE